MEIDDRIKCFLQMRMLAYHQQETWVLIRRMVSIWPLLNADDWVSPNFIERLVDTIQGADLAIVDLSDGKHEPIRPGKKGMISRESFFYYILCKIQGSCCNKLFIRSKIENERIRFPGKCILF